MLNYLKMLSKKFSKYLFLVLPIIVSVKSLLDCFSNNHWSVEYFVQYFMAKFIVTSDQWPVTRDPWPVTRDPWPKILLKLFPYCRSVKSLNVYFYDPFYNYEKKKIYNEFILNTFLNRNFRFRFKQKKYNINAYFNWNNAISYYILNIDKFT